MWVMSMTNQRMAGRVLTFFPIMERMTPGLKSMFVMLCQPSSYLQVRPLLTGNPTLVCGLNKIALGTGERIDRTKSGRPGLIGDA